MSGLGELLEKAGSIWLGVETLKAGGTAGNGAQEYPNVATGEDSDGSTIVSRRLVAGVSNAALLGGVAALLGLAVMAWIVVKD